MSSPPFSASGVMSQASSENFPVASRRAATGPSIPPSWPSTGSPGSSTTSVTRPKATGWPSSTGPRPSSNGPPRQRRRTRCSSRSPRRSPASASRSTRSAPSSRPTGRTRSSLATRPSTTWSPTACSRRPRSAGWCCRSSRPPRPSASRGLDRRVHRLAARRTSPRRRRGRTGGPHLPPPGGPGVVRVPDRGAVELAALSERAPAGAARRGRATRSVGPVRCWPTALRCRRRSGSGHASPSAAFSAGGEAALDAIERASYDVVAHRCRPRPHRLRRPVVGHVRVRGRGPHERRRRLRRVRGDHPAGGQELRLRDPPAAPARAACALGRLRVGPTHRRHRRRRWRRVEEKLSGLSRVRKDVDALATARTRCSSPSPTRRPATGLPMTAFGELIDGCEMDVHGTHYETIDELVGYCRRVAGTVGRLSLAVFGVHRARGRRRPGRRPRRRAPAHQHPARRRRGPGKRAGLPAGRRRRSGGLSGRPRRAARADRRPGRVRVHPGPVVVRPGPGAPPVARPAEPGVRRRHGRASTAGCSTGSRRTRSRSPWAGCRCRVERRRWSPPERWPGCHVVSRPDVVVVGGGLAGIAAALGAADGGASGHPARAPGQARRAHLVVPAQGPLVRQRPARLPAMLHRLPVVPRPDRGRRHGAPPGRASRSRCSRPAGRPAVISRSSLAGPAAPRSARSPATAISRSRRPGPAWPGRPWRCAGSTSTTPPSTTSPSGPWLRAHTANVPTAIAALWNLIALPTLNVSADDGVARPGRHGVPHRAPRRSRCRRHRLVEGAARRAPRRAGLAGAGRAPGWRWSSAAAVDAIDARSETATGRVLRRAARSRPTRSSWPPRPRSPPACSRAAALGPVARPRGLARS